MPKKKAEAPEECKWVFDVFSGEKAERALELCLRGYTLRKMAMLTPMEIADLLDYNELNDAEKAARRLREAAGMISRPMSLAELKKARSDKVLKTGVEEFDKKTPWGGVKFGLIYGFAGEFGTGKSLFAKQVAAIALAAGMKVAYFDTEGVFSIDDSSFDRILQRFGASEDAYNRMYLYKPKDSFELIEQLRELPEDVDVIIVDSLVAPFRAEYRGRQLLAPRQQAMLYALNILQRYCHLGKLAIVTDQVVDVPTMFSAKRPAGGNVFLHTVHALFMMERANKAKLEGTMWPLDVPGMSPDVEIKYKIKDDGLY
ncbi:Fis family transcriptional regulator [Pyrobaculum aerophilum]|uniref:Fis family transcriptional regulator n=1 Tax=Pyrobaculum aerophilum TaxID=13773 RepID=A0A371QU15_9CREN|nr:Fis family transcriptional regulator [Pyrobaculum aerophilum]RFA92373.1 Fis family transcriptional regulator [Pyrobaculum aerophilum]RFB00147.1 Fis family transcriptional regulator [Pyrobaculum aerophilum]